MGDLAEAADNGAAKAVEAVQALQEFLKRHPDPSTRSVLLTIHDEAQVEVPGAALEMLFDVLAHMALDEARHGSNRPPTPDRNGVPPRLLDAATAAAAGAAPESLAQRHSDSPTATVKGPVSL